MQEIDGAEALRFTLAEEASAVSLYLNRFFSNDEGTVYAEAGRLRLLDANGNQVGETSFVADASNGTKSVSLTSDIKFAAVEISAGVYDGDEFIFGALATEGGDFGAEIHSDATGKLYGGDFLLDAIELSFAVPLVGSGGINGADVDLLVA